jgi:serine/threonine protein kinase
VSDIKSDPTRAPTLPSRWRLLAELPTAHPSQVWVAEDLQLGEQVVLKVFPPYSNSRVRTRALTEVRLGLLLDHPHLVRLHEVFEAEEHLVAVMERVPGGDLARRIAFEGSQPVERVVMWTQQVLAVLAYLHEQDLIHRDVKPSNLLLTRDDDLKLADLGLAGRLDRNDVPEGGTAGVGTPGYMAPEHAAGGDPTPAWDLFSLGVTVRQMLSGERPIAETTSKSLPVGCPAWLRQFVERLLAVNPVDRWPSAVEALAVFEGQRAG